MQRHLLEGMFLLLDIINVFARRWPVAQNSDCGRTQPHRSQATRVVAKILADFEINDIAALPPLLCYNFYLCFDSSACSSERWFVSCARVVAFY